MSSRQQAIGAAVNAGDTAYHTFTTISAGTRERVTVGTVKEGAVFRSSALAVATVQDPGGDLAVGLFNGQEQVSPVEDTAVMATDELALPAVTGYDVGDDITVELDARNRSADIDVTVVVAGFRNDTGFAEFHEDA
jgi:hypothetical protein